MAKKVKKNITWLAILAIGLLIMGFNYWQTLPAKADVESPATSGTVNNEAPSVSGVNLRDADDGDIGLTEASTVTVYCEGLITDTNGGADISSCTSTVYRSGVTGGADCTADNANCYQIASGSCTLGAASGNDKNATATVDIYFYADPTDDGTYATANFPAETWQCQLTGKDAAGDTGSGTDSTPPDITTLTAFNITGSITYDALNPGSNMANLTQTVTASTTGNVPLDLQFRGDAMTSDGNEIAATNQKFSTTTNAAWADGIGLTGTYAKHQVDLSKPTSTPSQAIDTVYWGWAVPASTPSGSYTGTNYLNAVED